MVLQALLAALPAAASVAGGAMSMFGGKKGGSQSAYGPISRDTLAEYFQKAVRSADEHDPKGVADMPEWDWERLTGGDYNRLEEQLYQGPANRIIQEREIARAKFRDNLRKLGIADEPAGMALETQNITDPYGRQLTDAASQAATTRYGLQSQELEKMNPAKMEYGWNKYAAPRDFWLNKMKMFYAGMSQQGLSSTAGTPPDYAELGKQLGLGLNTGIKALGSGSSGIKYT